MTGTDHRVVFSREGNFLSEKSVIALARVPHQLMMSATPIPRTLSMSYFADLDVSIIDELPPGRTAIRTVVVGEDKREGVYRGIKREVDLGRQA